MSNQVKFYLEKRKDKDTGELITVNVPILLFYSFGSGRLQYYTGLRIDAVLWNEDEMRAELPKNIKLDKIQAKDFATKIKEINTKLKSLEVRVEEIRKKAEGRDEELTIGLFKEHLRTEKPIKGNKTFAECLVEYIDSSRLTKGKGTMRAINSTFNILKEFSKDTNSRLEFNNITQEFYDKLLDYCFKKKEYKNNYTGKLIKDLKAFLNWATERGYNKKLDFRRKSFKKLSEEPEIIFLTWEELMKLYKHKFKKGEERLEQIRDVFCFACFTGMRYSDLVGLEYEHIQNDFIVYRVVKTGQNNTIPLNSYSSAILKKYNKKIPGGKCLPVISEQNTNDYLKELLEKLKFNRKVQQIHFQGAQRIKTILPLHEAVTFHVSKKTFMTNFLAKGGSLLTAMSITGNKDLKTARRYYKVVDSLKAEEMARVFGSR